MNISMNLKKFEIALILKGQTETDLWRKNLKFKILCQTPFNELDIKFLYAPLNTNSIKEINICLQVSEINHFEMI